jgi:hypothetical protein
VFLPLAAPHPPNFKLTRNTCSTQWVVKHKEPETPGKKLRASLTFKESQDLLWRMEGGDEYRESCAGCNDVPFRPRKKPKVIRLNSASGRRKLKKTIERLYTGGKEEKKEEK